MHGKPKVPVVAGHGLCREPVEEAVRIICEKVVRRISGALGSGLSKSESVEVPGTEARDFGHEGLC